MLSAARIHPGQWQMFKALRLASLQEAPYAFGSTYAQAVLRSDSDWQEMVAVRAVAVDNSMFFAFDGGVPVGLAGAYRDEHGKMQLVSVWVAPSHRGTGAGALVVEATCGWAASRGAESIVAWVTSGNGRALRFYERLGFRDTGRRVPHPRDIEVIEIEMVRRLGAGEY